MFNKIKLSLIIFATLNLSLLAVPVKTHALFEGSKGAACAGVDLSNNPTGCDPKGSANTINQTIGTAINILSFAVGIIAIIMMIIGGVKFVLSGGDSSATTSARNTVLYAAIGLVIAVLAQVIVRFVLFKFE